MIKMCIRKRDKRMKGMLKVHAYTMLYFSTCSLSFETVSPNHFLCQHQREHIAGKNRLNVVLPLILACVFIDRVMLGMIRARVLLCSVYLLGARLGRSQCSYHRLVTFKDPDHL